MKFSRHFGLLHSRRFPSTHLNDELIDESSFIIVPRIVIVEFRKDCLKHPKDTSDSQERPGQDQD